MQNSQGNFYTVCSQNIGKHSNNDIENFDYSHSSNTTFEASSESSWWDQNPQIAREAIGEEIDGE